LPTKLWSVRGSLAYSELLTKRANEYLDELAANGSKYRETHINTIEHGSTGILLITIVYEEAGKGGIE
jgi:hypothetical protein